MRRDNGGTILTLASSTESGVSPQAKAAAASREREEVSQQCENNSRQFLRMEEPIYNAAMMARVVQNLTITEDLKTEFSEHSVWAIFHLCDMVKGLRDRYSEA